MNDSSMLLAARTNSFRDYFELCKPKVVALMLVTAYVGMHMATPGIVAFHTIFFAMTGIALAAGSAAVINHLVDQRIDSIMARTHQRPIPSGRVSTKNAILFAVTLAVTGMALLVFFVNMLTAILTFATLIGYAVIYTMLLKRTTPQNIVIGGAAGAAPPLLGWVAVTGHFDPNALLLVLIIFTWTPPHFWALAIYRAKEYAKAKIPMLPVTHGIPYTKLSILLYTILLVITTLLPVFARMNGIVYLMAASILGAIFLFHAIRLKYSDNLLHAKKMFKFSILYLFLLFVIMMLDHYLVNHDPIFYRLANFL